MSRSIKAFLLLLICSSSLLANELLFVGFDAGETNIWVQILKNWEDAPKSQVLTMATATKVAKAAGIEVIEVACPVHQRLDELPQDELDKISEIPAQAIVTGMYSTPERQIAEVFAKKGSKVYAVWDNFSTYDKLPVDLVANVEKILRVADVVIVPSSEIAKDLNNRFSTDKAVAMGQPTLDLWEAEIARVDKKAALAKTSLRADRPILTYIGGYEEKGNEYNASFEKFAQSVGTLSMPVQIIVQLHPRSDGSFEKKTLENLALRNRRFPSYFISDGKNLTTFEALALADMGVCHRSTVAIQSLFGGKRCIHIDVPGTPFSHFAIVQEMVPQCVTVAEAASYISEHLNEPIDTDNLYEKGGIPSHATQKYRDFLSSP